MGGGTVYLIAVIIRRETVDLIMYGNESLIIDSQEKKDLQWFTDKMETQTNCMVEALALLFRRDSREDKIALSAIFRGLQCAKMRFSAFCVQIVAVQAKPEL